MSEKRKQGAKADNAGGSAGDRLGLLLRNAHEIIFVMRAGGKYTCEGGACENILGRTLAELSAGDTFERLLHPDDLAAVRQEFGRLLSASGSKGTVRYRQMHANGEWVLFEAVASRMTDDPAVSGIVINAREIGDLDGMRRDLEDKDRTIRELSDALGRLAITDSLTGLFNHTHIHEILRSEVERALRYSQPLSILMFDLDDFKGINEKYGHPMGDEVIKKVASVIRQGLRTFDAAGRYGGETFMVVLPQTALESARLVADRIRDDIGSARFGDGPLAVTASAGVAEMRDDDIEQIIDIADDNLYRAKKKGRNRVVW
jgi:diguanylate cyclase (GGDEF)-like protein/PAS domain S-box-containing protein